ncbi:Predicted thioesterase [Thalassobacillus cyri]|uniref:Predicted thioesterase n=1 Tax=Thalassobacillus cyri TaxID=571932 RepID=A0A1H4EPF8_9BACI|nr:thioesterase [Thalassobacillus cyri]SEA86787.1 Predicted thioesterase [Thalassobacillus cyri]
MKPGMREGQSAAIQTEVASEMFAQFGGEVVHPTFSTVSLVYYMEWASRKIILPYLEDSEEGMGGAVSVKHVSPAPEGVTIDITATVTAIKRNIVVTEVVAESDGNIIGTGEVKQVILPKVKIREILRVENKT